MSPRVPDPLRAPGQARAPHRRPSSPPSPEQKWIFAAASRLFDIVTRLPPLNSDVPCCSETAGQRSSSSRDLSRLWPQSARKHFPVNIVFPREAMPRKRPLILKLIVKVGAHHTPTSPIRPANPTGFFFISQHFSSLLHQRPYSRPRPRCRSLALVPLSLNFVKETEVRHPVKEPKRMRGYTKMGGKKCFSHMDEVFEKRNEKKHMETFIYMTLGSLFCIFTDVSFYLSSYPW